MAVVKGMGKALGFALEEAKNAKTPLYILFVKEQSFVTDVDSRRTWVEDQAASEVFDVMEYNQNTPKEFLYTIKAHTAHAIVEIAKRKEVDRVVIGKKRKGFPLISLLKGTSTRDVPRQIPANINLVVVL